MPYIKQDTFPSIKELYSPLSEAGSLLNQPTLPFPAVKEGPGKRQACDPCVAPFIQCRGVGVGPFPVLREDSVELGEVPDLSLFPAGEMSIRLDAEAVPLSEAARTFGVAREQLLDMRLRWFDNQLIDKLLEMRYEKRF